MNTINGLQHSLSAYQTASHRLIEATIPSKANLENSQTAQSPNTQLKPSLESSVVDLKGAERMSEANIKALKTEDQLIGRLLDITV